MADRIFIGDMGAFYFDNIMLSSLMISAEDAKLFLLKQTNKSLPILSGTMDIFCLAGKPSSQPIRLIWP